MNTAVKAALLSAAPWFVTLVFSGAAVPAVADARPEQCLAPSGGDDTAALQAALDRCAGARRECSVALCAGVFPTGILRVRGFRGTPGGAGARDTVLRALPELPVSDRPGFFRDDPFDGAWPYLVQFIEGSVRIRDLGVSVPTPPEGSRPTTGWSLFPGEEPVFELRGAILLSGPRARRLRGARRAHRGRGRPGERARHHHVQRGGVRGPPPRPERPGAVPGLPAARPLPRSPTAISKAC